MLFLDFFQSYRKVAAGRGGDEVNEGLSEVE